MADEYDVIVVGGGGSGLAAALSAAEHGAKVLVLEKQPNLGGTTGIAIGSFTANGTAFQRKTTHLVNSSSAQNAVNCSMFLMPTHLAEFVGSLSWLRLRPMIDNPGPLGQTHG